MNISVRELDYKLSIKLGDPTPDNSDGENFDQVERLEYLERAYNKTIRLLRVGMNKYAPLFAKRKYTKEFNLFENNEKKDSFEVEGLSEIFQVYVGYILASGKGSYALAMRNDEEVYLSTKYGLNSQKTPSFEEKLFYYTIVDNEIKLLPEKDTGGYYNKAIVLYMTDGEKITNINTNLPLERNYIDLVLNFAAAEGMTDIARGDKASAFLDDAYSQIKLLQQLAINKKREVGIA